MKKSITLVSLLLASVSVNVFASEPEYTPDSKVLTIPIIKIGDSFVYDATLKLNEAGSFDIIGYSDTATSGGGLDAKCTDGKITLEKFKQIEVGMTLEQVNNIIGCKGELTIVHAIGDFYEWQTDTIGSPRISLVLKNDSVSASGKTFYP